MSRWGRRPWFGSGLPRPKPWEREYPQQYVCADCHTSWSCDHSRQETVLCACSICGVGRECVSCKVYQPKKATGRLRKRQMPATWRPRGQFLCSDCQPEHANGKSTTFRHCEKCTHERDCTFSYPEPFVPREYRSR